MNDNDSKKCPSCGSPVQENAAFCLHCMKPLVDKKVIEKKKSKKPYILWSAGAVGLVAVTFSLVFLICAVTDNRGRVEAQLDPTVTDTADNGNKTQKAESSSDTAKSDTKTETGDDGSNTSGKSEQTTQSGGTASGVTKDGANAAETSKAGGGTGTVTNTNQSSTDTGTGGKTSSSSSSTTPPAAHSHSYTKYTIKNATCGAAGETQFICSCGDKYSETVPATGAHLWYALTTTVHHDEAGHYENVEKARPINRYKCPACTYGLFDTAEEYYAHFDTEHKPSYPGDPISMLRDGYDLIEGYQYYTTQEWVVDKEAYDENVITGYKCSVCGAEK